MKRFKAIISVILSLIIIVSMAVCSIPSASAATVFTVDDVVYSIISDFEAHVYEYRGTNPVVEIPGKIGSRVITAVDNNAFYYNSVVEQVILPDSVLSIGNNAFMFCTNLNYVKIPVTLNSIGTLAFVGCSSLENIDINSNISKIPMNMFDQSGITSIKIPYNVQKIESQAFRNCKNLTTATLSSSVKEIGKEAFKNCTALEAVLITKSTTSIDSTAFTNCPNLTILGYFDSYAEEFALANDIPFEPIVNYALGDVDKDSDVTIYDATIIQKALVGIYYFGKEENYLADVNRDGSVTIDDATAIQKYLADLIPAFE